MFTVPDRTIIHRCSDNGLLSTFSIAEVADKLAQIGNLQFAKDFNRDVCKLTVSFKDNQMSARWADLDGQDGARMKVSSWAASQLANHVLPGHFFKGLRELAQLDPDLADKVWAKFASSKEVEAVVRTIAMRIEGKVYRVLRACVSDKYATYTNAELVSAILGNSGDYRNLPVLDWRLTDSGMRLRFVGMEDAVYGLAHFDASMLDEEVIPMVECWNSEVGRRSIGLRGGIYLARSSAAISHWDPDFAYTLSHRGSLSRIRASVSNSFRDMFKHAREVAEVYTKAKDIVVEQPLVYLETVCKNEISERVLNNAKSALRGDKVTGGGKLASIVEALAIAAKQEDDLYEQEQVERLASKVMIKGCSTAEKTGSQTIKAPKEK